MAGLAFSCYVTYIEQLLLLQLNEWLHTGLLLPRGYSDAEPMPCKHWVSRAVSVIVLLRAPCWISWRPRRSSCPVPRGSELTHPNTPHHTKRSQATRLPASLSRPYLRKQDADLLFPSPPQNHS